MLELNPTLVYQLIGFFILLLVLNRFLYKPLLKKLQEREDLTSGAMKEASDAQRDVDQGLQAYEKKMKEAALKGHEERSRLRQEAVDKEKKMIEAARSESAGQMASLREDIGRSKAAALSALKAEAKDISKNIAEKILERKLVIALFAFILPLLPLAGHASSGGGEHADSTMPFIWKAINFAILAVALYLIWTKVINKLLDKRSADIEKALNEAKAAREAAERKSAEYREKLSTLESTISDIQNEIRREGEAEKKRILADAEAAVAKAREQARVAAEQEVKKACTDIRREVAEVAVRMAEEILKKELSKDDHDRLAKRYVEDMRLDS